jgi:hypothetical protein
MAKKTTKLPGLSRCSEAPNADYLLPPWVSDLCEIVSNGKDVRSIKRALVAKFGSLALPFGVLMDWTNGGQAPTVDEYLIHTCVKALAEELVALDRWKRLADQDRQAYQKALKRLNSAISAVLNRHCGIEAHRPHANEDRDSLIVRIKNSRPDWSYAQIARKYKEKTGQEIDAGFVERIFKRRCERDIEEMIRNLRPDLDLEPFTRLFNVKIRRMRYIVE